MRIDASHRSWALASFTVLAIAGLAYVAYALIYPGGPNGNSLPGLIYGIVGYLMMLYAGLMGARKKVPLWRIGRAKIWMRGHLWIGALSLPMILFHSGFTARGPLTIVLTVLLFLVVLSGLTGALIQHFVPRRMTSMVQFETIYEQIPHVREQLRAQASGIVEYLCTDPKSVSTSASVLETGRVPMAVAEEDPRVDLSDKYRDHLRQVYNTGILPFLRDPEADSPLTDRTKAATFFEALRKQSPNSIRRTLGDLEAICEEQRQLSTQRRMYVWLHGWLLVHVPLSITLLVLGGIHGLIAVRY
jgi:Na+-transporting methylmalonyl-CoA/oxaloacetate decarboxylase gamma subunit